MSPFKTRYEVLNHYKSYICSVITAGNHAGKVLKINERCSIMYTWGLAMEQYYKHFSLCVCV